MTSKARVHAALNRQPVDRLPVWMWYHPETSARLSRELEVPPVRLADTLGDDVRQAWVANNFAMEGIVHEHEGESHTDVWGIEWVREGAFNQIRRSPLEHVDEAAARDYVYPYGNTEELFSSMAPVVAMARQYFVGCDISPCLLEMLFRLRGMEQTLLDLAGAPELSRAMLRGAADFSLHLAREACRRFPLDWLWTGDDVGGQQSMIVSPQRWREMIKPLLREIVEVGRDHGLWVAYHSCGAIRPIIPDLVEIGVDVLNPVQGTCPNMEPAELAREFGSRLAFMGGIDTQHLLPFGTRQEVFDATRSLIEAMAAGGAGYILAASHAVPPETPLENIFALYGAAGISEEEIRDRAGTIRNEAATDTAEAPR
jgi:uroporphyrinogen decarboxylase